MAERRTGTITTTRVEHVARPLGPARENGPHLGDLREFVAACDGLPDEALVHIVSGYMGESGRRDVTFRASYQHPAASVDAGDGSDGLAVAP